jgi:hypothetical protein
MKLRTLALAATLAALGCSTAVAAPATVGLRVEGETTTIFEGTVTTDGHAIEQDATGPHPCDGTNAGTNPAPGPTITSALDDAIAWDGRWSDGLQDFLVNRIGPDRNDTASNQFWGFALNYQASQLGGCQQQVKSGDEVLFAYDFFSAERYLRLSGPRRVRQGERFRVRVIDGQTGNPVEGARVLSKLTNERGYARARLRGRGVLSAKAVQEGAIRSNALRIRVR